MVGSDYDFDYKEFKADREREPERKQREQREEYAEHVIDVVGLNYGKPGVPFSPYYFLTMARRANVVTEILELDLGESLSQSLADYNSIYCQIEDLMKLDDKDQFAVFLTNNHNKLLNFTPQDLFNLLVKHSALQCLAALLDSQLKSHVDLNLSDPFPSLIVPSYRFELSLPMVSLLSHYGADPDVYSLFGTPLKLAVSTFSSRLSHHWNPGKSIFDLFNLIFSPQMKESLDIVKVLASKSKQVENLCFKYVADGKIIEFSTLLASASDKLSAQENTPVVQCVLEKLKCEANQLCERTSTSKGKTLADAINVVETFCLINGLLKQYGQLVPEVLSRLVREGWLRESADKDNIESLLSKPSLEAKEVSQKHYGSRFGGFSWERRMVTVGFSTLASSSKFPYQAFCTRQGTHFNHIKLVETRSKCALVKPSLMKKVASIMWLAKRSIK